MEYSWSIEVKTDTYRKLTVLADFRGVNPDHLAERVIKDFVQEQPDLAAALEEFRVAAGLQDKYPRAMAMKLP